MEKIKLLVSKNSDINLSKIRKSTLRRFGFLYSFLVLLLVGSIGLLYYKVKEDVMLEDKRLVLNEYSHGLISKLKDLHINFDKYQTYPRNEHFKSAIIDSDGKKIFSLLLSDKNIDLSKQIYLEGKYITYIKELESYYLGAKYIAVEIKDDEIWFDDAINKIAIVSVISFIVLLFLGYFLLNLFLKPMKEAWELLDRFVKDTTHELNTPVSAIISNIGMIDKDKLDEKLYKKINRIEIGAKTVSNIYEDLTYITLNNKLISQNKILDLSHIVKQRIEYFNSLAFIKKIKFDSKIDEDVVIFADEKKISKLIDNILSNAIKYNKINGYIEVVLKENYLSIKDSGKGIEKKDLNNLFDRYTRFDKNVGGFGIGLNIVWLIAKEYDLKIDISSQINIGTKVEVKW